MRDANIRREDVADADEGGTRSNVHAITTMSFIRERSAATTAMTDAKPAPSAALTCVKKL